MKVWKQPRDLRFDLLPDPPVTVADVAAVRRLVNREESPADLIAMLGLDPE